MKCCFWWKCLSFRLFRSPLTNSWSHLSGFFPKQWTSQSGCTHASLQPITYYLRLLTKPFSSLSLCRSNHSPPVLKPTNVAALGVADPTNVTAPNVVTPAGSTKTQASTQHSAESSPHAAPNEANPNGASNATQLTEDSIIDPLTTPPTAFSHPHIQYNHVHMLEFIFQSSKQTSLCDLIQPAVRSLPLQLCFTPLFPTRLGVRWSENFLPSVTHTRTRGSWFWNRRTSTSSEIKGVQNQAPSWWLNWQVQSARQGAVRLNPKVLNRLPWNFQSGCKTGNHPNRFVHRS